MCVYAVLSFLHLEIKISQGYPWTMLKLETQPTSTCWALLGQMQTSTASLISVIFSSQLLKHGGFFVFTSKILPDNEKKKIPFQWVKSPRHATAINSEAVSHCHTRHLQFLRTKSNPTLQPQLLHQRQEMAPHGCVRQMGKATCQHTRCCMATPQPRPPCMAADTACLCSAWEGNNTQSH